MTPTVNLHPPRLALVVAAHPDDSEFGCAGTVCKWTSVGGRAVYVVVTDGSKGTWREDVHPLELALKREGEQKKACEVLGAEAVHFLRYRDGELRAGERLIVQIAIWIRHLEPDVVLTHDPWRRYMLHPDHREVGRAVVEAVVAARDPGYLTELSLAGLAPHRPSDLLLWDADDPDHVEEISHEQFSIKVEALMAHESQFESTMGFSNPDGEEAKRFVEKLRAVASRHGALAGFELGEAFKRLDPGS